MRRFQQINLLLGAFAVALEAMPVLMFILAFITLLASTGMYLVEPRDNIESLPRAVYFTLVTITSLGYGDYTPSTLSGTIITCLLTVLSSLYMALPLGIIGHAFTSVWEDRHNIILMEKTRTALQQ